MTMWMLNGCDVFRQSHAFNWAGSTSHDAPIVDIECGCGAFVMKAHSGKIVPSITLERQIGLVASLAMETE